MNAALFIDSAELVILPSEVIRFTGGTACRAGDDLGYLVSDTITRATALIAPAFVYKICAERQSARLLGRAGRQATKPCLQPSAAAHFPTTAGLVICTLGPELDLEAARLHRAGAHLESFMLHGAGLAALQNLAHRASTEISELLAEQHLYPCGRLEPGCEGIELELQSMIFDEVDALPIGVSLNEYFVMQPSKSLSFIIGFSPSTKHHKDLSRTCQTCTLQDCAYRKTTSQR